MTDEEFLAVLERCELAAEAFTHAAHLRAGYLCLRAGGFDAALGRMRSAIQRYAAHLGKPDKYHETITVAYLALIHQRLSEGGDAGDWASSRSKIRTCSSAICCCGTTAGRARVRPRSAVFILPRRKLPRRSTAGRLRNLAPRRAEAFVTAASAVEKGILRRHRAAGVDADDILRARRHHHDAIDERAKDDAVAGFRHGLAPLDRRSAAPECSSTD